MQGGRNAEGPARVLLADNHTMFRQGLARILGAYEGIEVVGEVPNDEEVPPLARELHPDVVIMQVQMPFERAKHSVREMLSMRRPPKIVIVTMFNSPRFIRDLLELGASAYLLKSSSSEHLASVVRAVVSEVESEHTVIEMPRQMLKESLEGHGGNLSAREMEVLLLAARGLSDHQIASSLHVSERTVKRHLSNVYTKMDVSSRMQAARKALANGWITIEEITAEEVEQEEEPDHH